jgi:ribosomal protein S18 acetylase RimI-like enzyme
VDKTDDVLELLNTLPSEQVDRFMKKFDLKTDNEIATFFNKNQGAFWDFVSGVQDAEQKQDDTESTFINYKIETFKPGKHNIYRILHYFVHSVIRQDIDSFTGRISDEKDELTKAINGIIAEKDIVNVAREIDPAHHRSPVFGFLCYNYNFPSDEPDNKTIRLDKMAVLPKYQGQGISQAMIWSMISQNADRVPIFVHDKPENTIEKIVLYRPEDNERAIQFYKKIGFLHCEKGELSENVGKNEHGIVFKLMELPLTRKVFISHLTHCGRISKQNLKNMHSLSDEDLILAYYQMGGSKEPRYTAEEIGGYNQKKEIHKKLFDNLNPYLIPLVMKLRDDVIQKEPLFKEYL